jgi:RNA polymerase sigma-70 factor (ECF subfamily)
MPVEGVVTGLLRRSAKGDRSAEEELFAHVYRELREMAARRISAENKGHTLQPTALIHETYLAIGGGAGIDWVDRNHFFAVAGRAMRRILIDYARKKAAHKRPGARERVDLEKAQVFSLDNPEFMLALDECLNRLREQSTRACQVVELRAFAGLSLDDIATSLGISGRTVKRDWQMAKLWLYQELYGSSGRGTRTLG